jgi:hypothetical protein
MLYVSQIVQKITNNRSICEYFCNFNTLYWQHFIYLRNKFMYYFFVFISIRGVGHCLALFTPVPVPLCIRPWRYWRQIMYYNWNPTFFLSRTLWFPIEGGSGNPEFDQKIRKVWLRIVPSEMNLDFPERFILEEVH